MTVFAVMTVKIIPLIAPEIRSDKTYVESEKTGVRN